MPVLVAPSMADMMPPIPRSARPWWLRPTLPRRALTLADLVVLLICLAGTPFSMAPTPLAPTTILCATLLAWGGIRLMRAQDHRNDAATILLTSFPAAAAAAIAIGVAGVLQQAGDLVSIAPMALAGVWVETALGLIAVRLATAAVTHRWRQRGWLARTVLVVGSGEQGRRFIEQAQQHPATIRVLGVFDDRLTRVPNWIAGYPVLGDLRDLAEFVRRQPVDEIVLALPWAATTRIETCLEQLRRVPAEIALCPDLAAYHLTHKRVETSTGIALIALHDLPFTPLKRLAKAIEDRTIAGLALLLCAPLLLLLALLVAWRHHGRVFAREEYRDFEGRPLLLHAFAGTGRPRTEGAGGTRSEAADPLGRFLSVSHLDRLPRLLDVMAGRASLIGPLPHGPTTPLAATSSFDDHVARYRLKPGLVSPELIEESLTGLGQATSIDRRLAILRAYAESWSPWIDLRILLRAMA